jgi:hypothetical protein
LTGFPAALADGAYDRGSDVSYPSLRRLLRWLPGALSARQVPQVRSQVDRIWCQRLERADYAVARARRQYQLVELENRLMVRQLEKDWETR